MYKEGMCLYCNLFWLVSDVKDWWMEGGGQILFDDYCLYLLYVQDEVYFVYWCLEMFLDGIIVMWDFFLIEQSGLCMLFFFVVGIGGEDLFDLSFKKRMGKYFEYYLGDINVFYLLYFCRKYVEERVFCICNLRKSCGFYFVVMGVDLLLFLDDVDFLYYMKFIKDKGYVYFLINDLFIFEWMDDGSIYGFVLIKGKIGFWQMVFMKVVY